MPRGDGKRVRCPKCGKFFGNPHICEGGMKGHNYDHGNGVKCKKCGKIHKHFGFEGHNTGLCKKCGKIHKNNTGKIFPKDKYPNFGGRNKKYPKEKYPNHGLRKYENKFRKEHPEEYHRHKVEAGKEGAMILKRNKTGCFFGSKDVIRRARKKGAETSIKLGIGVFNPNFNHQEAGKKAAETNRKNKTSAFFDPKLQSKLGKKGGSKACKNNRENKPYYLFGLPCDSSEERNAFKKFFLSLCVFPIEGENCQIPIDGGIIDGRLWNTIFWEYHPWDFHGKTHKQYYKERREILNKNGFKDYPLIVFKSLKEVDIFLKMCSELNKE